MTDHTTCHGCRHLSYEMPDDAVSAAAGGTYSCGLWRASMPASEEPTPLHSFENTTTGATDSCKEPK